MSLFSSAMPAVPQYLSIIKNESIAVQHWQKTSPLSENIVSSFKDVAGSILTPEQLLHNYKALSVVLGAYGMSSVQGETAVLKQLMSQNPSSSNSLAARSGNPSWQLFAKDFSSWSVSPFSSKDFISKIVNNYWMNAYEKNVQHQTSGLGDALYFSRIMKPGMKLENVMADPKLLKVVERVSGFDPTQFGTLGYNEQVRLLSQKLDLSKLNNSEKIQRYAQQYLALLQIHPEKVKSNDTILTLYGESGDSDGILSLFTGGNHSTENNPLLSALV
ncbi:DUF1217 domain-containing protein [Swingsia samuiensis]|uniref:DUF1217 domain-containing protein n=1 Tax=Swingsia samuiensis TaxID=1293412 RepID=A0A4Y6UJJ5_9PROT|nr:DUF1217 domain-containing protein [Swingsia samuiensis]QDH16175.1 DUF1217 domain-containing protein [Swingsia samuiensis]